jgi:hypothetical protein
MPYLKKITKIGLKIIYSCLILSIALPASALTFNPNYIISDSEITDYTMMNLEQVQRFLLRNGSYLANYVTVDNDGQAKSASQIIYERCLENKLNTQFILVLLQKEQSLIEDSSPDASQLDWATGYGCPDSGGCNSRWQGFFKQINSATLQFRDYLDNPHLYNYKKDATYIFQDKTGDILNITEVRPINLATAALYNYTPHVYNGNYNFWRLWQEYFTKSYPDGSLLQEKGQPGIWLIQYGKKRAFMSKAALLSRYNLDKVVQITHNDLEKYETGDPIKFAQYSLLRSPKGTVYLLVDDTKRGIASGAVFKKLGYNKEEIIDVDWEDLNRLPEGQPLTEKDIYPTGALLQDKKTGGVYFVYADLKYPIWGKELLNINFPKKKIIPTKSEELDKWPTGEPVKIKDGELVKTTGNPSVYIVSNGERRAIASAEAFSGLGYKWEQIKTVSEKVLSLHPEGEPLDIATTKQAELKLASS